MKIFCTLIITLLGLATAGNVFACEDPLKASFREIVSTAPTIFTFQVTSAFYIHKSLGSGVSTEYVVGHIKVVDYLKGDGSSFKLIKYSFGSCGSIRMSVGQIHLAATSQTGQLLQLWGAEHAILDLTQDFYDKETMSSPAVAIVKRIIGGSPVPKNFPRDALELPLEVYPVPPPPPPPPPPQK